MSEQNQSKAVAPVTGGASNMEKIANLTNGVAALYSSIKGETLEERLQILSAVTDPEPVSEHLGETLNLQNVIVQATQVTDPKTGEVSDVLRTILITEEGDAYAAISTGIFQYLQNLFDIVGHPSTWSAPLPVQVVEKKGRSGYRYMTVKVVS